jgi:hypothetical protein
MQIPPQALAAETLYQLVESVVLREGTDYGDAECSHGEKVAQLLAQVQAGHAVILYSELHESVDIIPLALYQARIATHAE